MPVFMCGRSLSAWWCMVAGNVLHHVEREGELSGQGNVPGGYVPGESPGGMSYTLPTICSGVTAEKNDFGIFMVVTDLDNVEKSWKMQTVRKIRSCLSRAIARVMRRTHRITRLLQPFNGHR